ncbi:MAG TPA: HD domain-containing phosphohydrolase [Bryobacteraceae bacterium]|jgi:putative nucleotidyltransferase with HDIG domain
MDIQQQPAVVVVEDDAVMREYLAEALEASGCGCNLFSESASALAYLASVQQPPDLVLSDVNMPGMNGIDLLRTVRSISPDLPFILISGLCELATAMDAVKVGASDYLLKPARKEDIVRLVTKHVAGQPGFDREATLRALSAFLSARRLSGGDRASLLAPLLEQLGLKRLETLQHSHRVAGFARLIGKEAGLDGRGLEALELGALLHDIGKAGIPHNVLMKPDVLNEKEWRVMRLHPVIGWELLNRIGGVREEANIVHCHHERFGGGGYPRGLEKNEIPIGARIFSIADTLDAIISDRPYRKGKAIGPAREEIVRYVGAQFDPEIVHCFERVPDESIEYYRDNFRDPDATAGDDRKDNLV